MRIECTGACCQAQHDVLRRQRPYTASRSRMALCLRLSPSKPWLPTHTCRVSADCLNYVACLPFQVDTDGGWIKCAPNPDMQLQAQMHGFFCVCCRPSYCVLAMWQPVLHLQHITLAQMATTTGSWTRRSSLCQIQCRARWCTLSRMPCASCTGTSTLMNGALLHVPCRMCWLAVLYCT